MQRIDNLLVWVKLKVWKVLGVSSDHQMNRVLRRFISRTIWPCLVSLQFWVFYYFFWFTDHWYSWECLMHFVVCAVLDYLVLWSKQAASQDPGYVNSSVHLLPCKKCDNSLKTSQVHHCKSCDKCVFLMDHHCMWTDQCVGYYTMKPFVLFNFYVCLISLYGLMVIAFKLFEQLEPDGSHWLVRGAKAFV